MFCSHCALKALGHLTSVGSFQASCSPEMNYDMMNLKEEERGSWMRFQAWKDREDEVSKGGVLSDEEAWWMCVSMLQKQSFVWVGFSLQSSINGHIYWSSLTCRAAFCWAAMCCCSAVSLNSLGFALEREMLLDGEEGNHERELDVYWELKFTCVAILTWLWTGSGSAVSSLSPTRPRLPPEPCSGRLWTWGKIHKTIYK